MTAKVAHHYRLTAVLDDALAVLSQHPLRWTVLIWLLLVLPGYFVRGAYFEEATIIGLARGAIEDGWWLSPHLYGVRFVERPVLMSWLIAAVSWPAGWVLLQVARLPTVVSGLAGAMLVYFLARRRASPTGATVAALCFVASPAIFQNAFVAEPDMLVSIIMFVALVIWWLGEERGQVTPVRWLAVGLILTVAGLVKGPQPLAFFCIGIFAFYGLRRDWRAIPGLILCGFFPATIIGAWYLAVYQPGDLAVWQRQSRLFLWHNTLSRQLFEYLDYVVRYLIAILPSAILIAAGWRPALKPSKDRDLLTALLLYAVPCSLLLGFWPGAHFRYAMPGIPALAVVAGVVFDQMRLRENPIRYVGLGAIVTLLTFQLGLNWAVMANFPDLFAKSRFAGHAIAAAMTTKPAPLYALPGVQDGSILTYLPPPIRRVNLADLAQMQFPAWALLTADEARQLQAARPDLNVQASLVLRQYDNAQLAYIDQR